ncbi:hypothetical protein SDJN02_15088, partial [Cucurbita argyrosperma subsp. argyrosperma]
MLQPSGDVSITAAKRTPSRRRVCDQGDDRLCAVPDADKVQLQRVRFVDACQPASARTVAHHQADGYCLTWNDMTEVDQNPDQFTMEYLVTELGEEGAQHQALSPPLATAPDTSTPTPTATPATPPEPMKFATLRNAVQCRRRLLQFSSAAVFLSLVPPQPSSSGFVLIFYSVATGILPTSVYAFILA